MTSLPQTCDAVVIGAGLGGLALAIRLQAAGRRVVLAALAVQYVIDGVRAVLAS